MNHLRRLRYLVMDRLGRSLLGGRLEALAKRSAEDRSELERLGAEVAGLHAALDAERRDLAQWRADALGRTSDPAATRALEERLNVAVDATNRSLQFLALRANETVARARPRTTVSVIVPVRNRPGPLRRAIESVLAQASVDWELIVVDDGSTDETLEVARSYATDPRVVILEQPWRGAPAARNHGVGRAKNDVVVYLDSDVTLQPGYLAALATEYDRDARMDWSYAARLIEYRDGQPSRIQLEPFGRAALEHYNFIDTNVIAHRRGLETELGGWDESLVITADWELALRWSGRVEPKALPLVACRYELGSPDQLTHTEPRGFDNYRVRRRHARRRNLGIRVLYAVAHYPQLTESYVEQEIRAARESGVEVEVWGFEPPESPFETDVPIHTGTLAEAVASASPDLLHVHWLDAYFQRSAELRATGLPIFVRGHGYELSAEKVAMLEADPGVSTVFLVPHFAERWSKTGKVVPAWVGFRPDLYYPEGQKDRRLVFRAAAGLPTKNLDALFDLAQRNPQFRFVLAVGRAGGHGAWVDGLLERHRASGSPLEIHVNLPHERVADLSRRAGIYLHTHTLEQPFSSPISIVEAMASGSYLLVPECEPARRYTAECADYYRELGEVDHLLRATLEWDGAEWKRRGKLAIDRAFDHFEASIAVLPILKCWLGALGRPWPDG